MVKCAGLGPLFRASLAFCVAALSGLAAAQIITTVAGGWTGDGGPATRAVLWPFGSVVDQAGNVYVIDMRNYRIRKIAPDGVITTVAGNGESFSNLSLNAPATSISVDGAVALALDTVGNLYIAARDRVIKVDTSGMATQFAGAGFPGYSGDGGPAAFATLRSPAGLAFDRAGNLYIADQGNHRIRKVAPDGMITTVAGNGINTGSGDTVGPALNSSLQRPCAMAVDNSGAFYFVDGNRIRKVFPNGTIATYAGSGNGVFNGDGGAATSAGMQPACGGIAFDASGALYFADQYAHRVRRVTSGGFINTVAGTGPPNGFGGDGGPAASASFSQPEGVSVDASGNLYVADRSNLRLRKISASGVIATYAGGGDDLVTGDGGTALAANLASPVRLAFDGAGNLFVTDQHRVRKIDAGGAISTVVGNGMPGSSGDGGLGNQATTSASNVSFDAAGNMYLSETLANRVRKVDTRGFISTVAGSGIPGFGGDGGSALFANLGSVYAAVADRAGNVFISNGNRIRKVAPDGIISTWAGNGQSGFTGDGGPANIATLSDVAALAFDSAGNLYFADANVHRIRKITPGGIISTYAGNGVQGFAGDGGQATNASLALPNAIAFDSQDNLYISDHFNYRIRKVTPGGVISTVAGNGSRGFRGDGEFATSAALGLVGGVASDGAGNLYIADYGNHRIRKVALAVPQQRTVIEYYNTTLRHYFIAAEIVEQHAVDTGAAGPGWVRTGDTFKAYAATAAPQGALPVYRFYGSVTPGPNSHFYTASPAERDFLQQLQASTPANQPRWNYEGIGFAAYLPVNGQCPAHAPTPVYRAYNNRAAQIDSNHRFTTRLADYQNLIAEGWIGEGIAMCGAQ